jgi:hypothetical protein
MKIITISLFIAFLATLGYQQNTNSYNGKVNFEGDFDSLHPIDATKP